ncbi:nucleobase:cation symporter-2 family protein [Nonomuraea sediminis]|uniref:nucleobase:cation symporter-2 family protein n=1 Tax=Nonomuraea sediminis TaxID=2835864 RepID=UPI001BDD28B6|nr:nucleobase:cation symporter-2 family protein [Nonomuraea sediminis]
MNSEVDARLPIAQLGTLGLQHVLAMYAGAVAVPLIVGGALKLPPDQLAYLINADLLVSGIATLIQCVGVWRFGIRLPIMQGCTFAAVTPMVMIGTAQGGLPAVYGAVIVSGLLVVAIAPYFAKVVRFFPPLVTGTIITIIGISLLPVAARWAAGGVGSPGFGSPKNIAMAAAVLLLILAIYRFSTGFLSRVAVLAGIAAGTAAAIPLGFTDFSHVGDAALFGISTPFAFGLPTFQATAIISMVIVMLVSMTETTGDFVAVAEMTDSELTPRRLADGLRADGLSTALGGVFNTFPYTAFAQNVGLVGLTKVKSRWVVATAGGILVVLGLIPVLGAVIAAIPQPVLGGAGIAMFGTVAASGIRTLSKADFAQSHNLVIVAVAIGVAAIPIGAPTFYEQFPDWAKIILNSGISTGSLLVIVLNLVFNHARLDQPTR